MYPAGGVGTPSIVREIEPVPGAPIQFLLSTSMCPAIVGYTLLSAMLISLGADVQPLRAGLVSTARTV